MEEFVQNLQTLMKFSKSKIGESILSSANISQLHLVEEPEMYISSSGESKYSEEDRNYRDHALRPKASRTPQQLEDGIWAKAS